MPPRSGDASGVSVPVTGDGRGSSLPQRNCTGGYPAPPSATLADRGLAKDPPVVPHSARRRAERPHHVWSYDFVFDRTADGRPLRILAIVDEYTRECLSLDVARRLRSDDILARLAQLFVERGPPTYLRSDNGPEFTATVVREWLHRVGVTTLFIAPGSPWENGYVESFNGKLRDECLNRERFDTLLEAQILIEGWRREYNQIRPHSALGYRPPAPESQEIRPPLPAQWADRRLPALT